MGQVIETKKRDAFAVFCGTIDGPGVERIFRAYATAMANQTERLHLLLHSTGGIFNDGICLYNYFRTLPLEVVAYNAGTVASA